MNVLAANASCAQYGGCPPSQHHESLAFTGLELGPVILFGIAFILAALAIRFLILDKRAKKKGKP